MTTKSIPIHIEASLWARIGHWLHTIDEAIHHDPTEALHHRIETLENKLIGLESKIQIDKGEPQ